MIICGLGKGFIVNIAVVVVNSGFTEHFLIEHRRYNHLILFIIALKSIYLLFLS